MVYINNTGRLGFSLHQCVLRNTLAGSKTVVSISRDATVCTPDRSPAAIFRADTVFLPLQSLEKPS